MTLPNPILLGRALTVAWINSRIRRLAHDMLETMRAASGIGLAAPQVGVQKRVIVVDMGDAPLVLVNPKVAATEGEQVGLEGCLSVPDLVGGARRAEWVMVKGLNGQGWPVNLEGAGQQARVLQHEIDHLDGILFIVLIEDPTRLWSVSELSTAAEREVVRIWRDIGGDASSQWMARGLHPRRCPYRAYQDYRKVWT
ncbi:peptide deformylase [Chloroflexota bacterium]